MKIAVIGGGAAGLACVHYLAAQHEIYLFEKTDKLGGHVKTLNRNVQQSVLPKDIYFENGVLGFHYLAQPTFKSLIKSLQIPTKLVMPYTGTNLFLNNKSYYSSPTIGQLKHNGCLAMMKNFFNVLRFTPGLSNFYLRLLFSNKAKLKQQNFEALLSQPDARLSQWLRAMIMLGYSTHFQDTNNFPACLAKRLYKDYLLLPIWWVIPGGVYSYMDRILSLNRNKINLQCNSNITSVERKDNIILIIFNDGQRLEVDKVIFAIPPDQVLSLLNEPSTAEQENFSKWRGRKFTTIAHTDKSLYDNYSTAHPTICDYFEKNNGDFFYNTYMNDYYQITKPINCQFSYNAAEFISVEHILHTENHWVPIYDNESLATQAAIKKLSGQMNTYYAGAYLYDGLHEGAIVSAYAVQQKIINCKVSDGQL
jgi:predicted NAD/FAD-binding protein